METEKFGSIIPDHSQIQTNAPLSLWVLPLPETGWFVTPEAAAAGLDYDGGMRAEEPEGEGERAP